MSDDDELPPELQAFRDRINDLWTGHYILDANGQPVPCHDVLEWGRWFETAERHVAQDKDEAEGAEPIWISTVFLGLDHQYGDGPPVLWETMVFRGKDRDEIPEYTTRYSSLAEALAGHQRICAEVSAARGPKTSIL